MADGRQQRTRSWIDLLEMHVNEPRKQLCSVIVTVNATPEDLPVLEAHARFGLSRFPDFEGFVSGALHRSADGTRLVQSLCWTSELAYRACVEDPQWDDLPSTRKFMRLVDTGAAAMDVRLYDVVAQSPGRFGPIR